jgi:hypothetical protein
MKVHPIQMNYRLGARGVVCGLCGADNTSKYPDTPDRVTHLVHLVREHLAEVNRTFTKDGKAEEIEVKG